MVDWFGTQNNRLHVWKLKESLSKEKIQIINGSIDL